MDNPIGFFDFNGALLPFLLAPGFFPPGSFSVADIAREIDAAENLGPTTVPCQSLFFPTIHT